MCSIKMTSQKVYLCAWRRLNRYKCLLFDVLLLRLFKIPANCRRLNSVHASLLDRIRQPLSFIHSTRTALNITAICEKRYSNTKTHESININKTKATTKSINFVLRYKHNMLYIHLYEQSHRNTRVEN